MQTRWRFFVIKDGHIKSDWGRDIWKIGEWKHVDNLKSGFFCSKEIVYAFFTFDEGNILAKVEVRGTNEIEGHYEAWSDMRILKTYKWNKIDTIALSAYSAESCLKYFKKKFPNDKRPYKKLADVKKWIDDPTKQNDSRVWCGMREISLIADEYQSIWLARKERRSIVLFRAYSAMRSVEETALSIWRRNFQSLALSCATAEGMNMKMVRKISKWLNERVKRLEHLTLSIDKATEHKNYGKHER